MSDIFISYAREDRPRAAQLAQALEAQGWSVWWDRVIPAGRTFDDVIEEAIDAASCVLVLWSRQSVGSEWVRTEAQEGRARDVLVPIFIEDVKPPLAFRRVHAADLTAWDGTESWASFQVLLADIARHTGPSPRTHGEGEAAAEAERKREAEAARVPVPPKGADDPLNRAIWVEGGTFQMGSTDGDSVEQPVHQVTVSGFWMQEHPVTNEEYRRFVAFPSGQERHPVVNVNWQQAMDYAASRGGSLPTEAQWEFAARGTEGRTYPWGDPKPDDSRANFGDPNRGTRPVGSYPAGATPEGVHDLAGNVWEWVRDWYGHYPSGAVTDPTGPASGSSRVVRGGSFDFNSGYLRGSSRLILDPGHGFDFGGFFIGFRVAWAGGQ